MCIVQVLRFTSSHKEREVENGHWIKISAYYEKGGAEVAKRRGIYYKKSTRLLQIISALDNKMVKKLHHNILSRYVDVRDQKTHCAPVLKAEQVYMCTVQFSKTKSGKTKVIS